MTGAKKRSGVASTKEARLEAKRKFAEDLFGPNDMRAAKPLKSRVWKTYLRIDSTILGDTPPVADPVWLQARGIEESSPIVIGLIRKHILPLRLKYGPASLPKMWFLVHNRESGVPCDEKDKGAYLDITLFFHTPKALRLPAPFVMTHVSSLGSACAGWDLDKLKGGIFSVYEMLNRQAMLVLEFMHAFDPKVDDLTVLKHLRQYLHYLSNISQMRIS